MSDEDKAREVTASEESTADEEGKETQDAGEEAPNPPPHGQTAPEAEAAEGEPEEEPAPPPHGRVPPEQKAEEQRAPTLADLDIYDTLRFMIGLLNQAAWIHLGLVVPPGASEARTDLVQARVAIDSLEALVEKLMPKAKDDEKRELTTMLANLRINYVRKAG